MQEEITKDQPSIYDAAYYPEKELSEDETRELVRRAEEKAASVKTTKSFLKYLTALGRYLFDGDVKWYKKAVVAAALIYFIAPIDAMPDFIPFAGLLDDMGVIAWTIRYLGKEIEGYY